MNILAEPLANYVILFENRDLQFIKKKCDSQFIQNCAALIYVVYSLHVIYMLFTCRDIFPYIFHQGFFFFNLVSFSWTQSRVSSCLMG